LLIYAFTLQWSPKAGILSWCDHGKRKLSRHISKRAPPRQSAIAFWARFRWLVGTITSPPR